jgi:DNA-binding LacI/PurR family transcriptional regulator
VPGDVSVVGYDDSAFMNCTDPPLTTVRQPIEAMGKAAVALLVSQIENVAVYPEELLFEPELVVRGSTGRAAVVTSPVVSSPVSTGPVVTS